ncbi:DUF2716 domain-containing protein [Actinospica durhamensis]|uniref:DUF2716 domain-containing protein n=1 Tax=Actinospica durhamensis TaxID=1508375 RepID=A0A941EQC2_9ACTN|nr:DUF2716 domain-containing protein [Actinospica durhamensis]MBR7835208.1 DUF2716 domain-containing protein [Actinospica durhamensis]
MPTTVEALRAPYDEQVRAQASSQPLGAVVEEFDLAAVTHYGTHGTVAHTALSTASPDGIAAVVGKVQASAANLGEPVEWRVYAHDPGAARLVQELTAVGFTPGWQRSVLIAEIDEIAMPALPGPTWTIEPIRYGNTRREVEAQSLARQSGPHRVALSEWLDVGRSRTWSIEIAALANVGGTVAVGWAEDLTDTQFIAIGGMSAPRTELLAAWVTWTRCWFLRGKKRYISVDADGALREALLDSGFHEVTSVQSFHLCPPGPRETVPPVKQMIADPEDVEVWRRVTARLRFSSRPTGIRIAAPQDSFTWSTSMLDHPDDARTVAVEHAVQRALRTCTHPGEYLYFQRYGLQGFRFDPQRVGIPGRPHWPGTACAWDEYHFLTTADARMGTYADPTEQTLCVFGTELLDAVSAELSRLLGNNGIWTFG